MAIKRTRHRALFLIGASALSVGFVLGIGGARTFWSQETAAWVQAVGSIAAIIWAVEIAGQQAAERRYERALEVAQTHGVAERIADMADQFLMAAEHGLSTRVITREENFAQVAEALGHIDVMTLTESDAAGSVIELRRMIGFYKLRHDEAVKELRKGRAMLQETRTNLDSILGSARTCIEHLRQCAVSARAKAAEVEPTQFLDTRRQR